jgi:hypothetical protein
LASDSRSLALQERPPFIGAEPARIIRRYQVSEFRHSIALRACVLEML